eukprot:CAMPEP_0171472556 /NCGR_PEP_ID=MMETSP0946-20130122/1344_1 /TAXON_ID=109269 /ORGANISM="Vaucheria litorea, Strain CCMP2940" /LENGTH=232 /DNA_ID=CAMNT_0012002207 /DNA_START=53 /DNA_END=748 /DNA_ORIENTATION=+
MSTALKFSNGYVLNRSVVPIGKGLRTKRSQKLKSPKRAANAIKLHEEIFDLEEFAKEKQERVGKVTIRNTQRKYDIDTNRLERDLSEIKRLIGYDKWDCHLWLTTDATVKKLNRQFRKSDKSTDILSFQIHEATVPGTLKEVYHPEEMVLGEMIISLQYVDRVAVEDKHEFEKEKAEGIQAEYERGVSGAMARVYSVEERIPYLCIHGLLHLVGYDHESDEDFQLMAKREEE